MCRLEECLLYEVQGKPGMRHRADKVKGILGRT